MKQSIQYQLICVTERHFETLYQWNRHETQFECYTCRPIVPCPSFEEYARKTLEVICQGKHKIYVLVKKGSSVPLGKITLFDYNRRNHSAEFGYYFPACNRGQGLGKIMLGLFLEEAFRDDDLDLNKLYATTCADNAASIHLLESFGFHLDGRLREHYWIEENRFDQLVFSMLRQEWKTEK